MIGESIESGLSEVRTVVEAGVRVEQDLAWDAIRWAYARGYLDGLGASWEERALVAAEALACSRS